MDSHAFRSCHNLGRLVAIWISNHVCGFSGHGPNIVLRSLNLCMHFFCRVIRQNGVVARVISHRNQRMFCKLPQLGWSERPVQIAERPQRIRSKLISELCFYVSRFQPLVAGDIPLNLPFPQPRFLLSR